jgi:hypothetical protein
MLGNRFVSNVLREIGRGSANMMMENPKVGRKCFKKRSTNFRIELRR